MPVVALYARVSSDQQAKDRTIDSQLHALRDRITQDRFAVADHLAFTDDGHSGSTLLRPALERLRDQIAAKTIDRLYVLSPDRLARKYAYQVLLLDEFKRSGVDVVFLNHALGSSPEEDLLLQVQGMIAEYERAKILERSRRGKLQAARRGSVNVLLQAPFGYRYLNRHEGAGEAALVIDETQAQVVRDIFQWVAEERCTLGEIARRLKQAGVASPSGKPTWSRGTLGAVLRNSTYQGTARYGKTRNGERRPQLRRMKGQSAVPKSAHSRYRTKPEEQITITVPAIVTPELFAAVRAQLQENKQRHRTSERGVTYMLQGLAVCALCDHAFYGKAVTSVYKGKRSRYVYYRCVGCEPYRYGGEKVCDNRQVRSDKLEDAVWSDVRSLLGDRKRMEEEVRRRLSPQKETAREAERVRDELRRGRAGLSRVLDAYENGLMERGEFEERVKRLRERVRELEGRVEEQTRALSESSRAEVLLGSLNRFATTVRDSLATANWTLKRDVIRGLVKRVEIDKEEIRVVYRIPPQPFREKAGTDGGFLQLCPDDAHSSQPTK
ncbi:MAG: recombinase family protein [Gemmataceae bacterium]